VARARAKASGVASGFFLAAARGSGPASDRFPWSVPLLHAFRDVRFRSAVTFIMGENGSGKSTFLEALAIASNAVAVGATDLGSDTTFAGARAFADTLTLTNAAHRPPSSRLFFRAEDALGFGRRVESQMAELEEMAAAIDAEAEADGDVAGGKRRAAGYLRGERRELAKRYGVDPHAQSHGEAFVRILSGRLVPKGLYFLDEPETPLSPTRVLALMVMLRTSVRAGSQFVIATHSPMLAALPGASILLIDGDRFVETPYEELEHVRVTRDFLNAPERYLRHLEDAD
jgi:predicted ATPase